ncbi:LysE family transporter [Streptomyces hundungensis]|uniref:LysE family translocator n=1 Tax=Streptomyces hundungensis TaxID=1077946 RepID=UPI0033E7CD80
MAVDLVGFLGVVLAAYVVPGPDFLVVLRSAAEHPSKGRAAGLGAQAGLCVHMLAAATGLSLIAARSPLAYDALKLLGAAYRALLDRPTFRRRWELTTGWLFIAIGIGVAATA